MGSGPSHEEKDGTQTPLPTTRHRGSTSGDPASMRRMHWVIYDAKGKHSIIAEHDVITGRRLLVADGQQIVYKKRVLLDRGDTFPFIVGTHHCVVMIRDMELKFLYGLIVDGLPVHEYHQKFFQNALYYTFPITVSPFSPTHQYTPSSSKSEDLSSPANEHVQNLEGIEETSSLESDTLSPQEAVAVADTLIASAVVSRRKSKADISSDTPEASVVAAASTSSLPTTPNTRGASKSVVSSVPTIPPTSAIPATATYTIHNPNHHTCIVITHPSLAVLVDDEPVELHSQFAELTTELFNTDNHIHDGENLHIVHHDAQHEPNPNATVDGTIHGFTCDSFLTVCELLTRPVNKNRPAVGTNTRSPSTPNTLSIPSSDQRRSLTIHTGNTDTIPLISTSPHTSPHDDTKTTHHRETSSLPNSMPSSPTAATTAATSTSTSISTSTSTSTSTSSSNISSGFEYELRVNGFVQEALPPPPVPYFNQAAILEQQAMEIPIARLRQEYEKWKESH